MLLVAMVSLQRGKQLGETRTESIKYALPGRPRPPLQLCFW
jgi:hypothetical protein